MIGVPVAPRRVFGVVLAAGEEAGRRTWVCRAHPGAGGIRVESVESLDRLPGGAVDANGACRGLVGKVLEAPRSAWGFDFAFGLPVERPPADGGLSPGLDSWRKNLDLIEACPGPDDLAARAGAGRRRTDEDHDLPAPLSPGRRGPTWLGGRGILRPLHGQQGVAILPIDPLPLLTEGMPPAMRARVGTTYLLEVAPPAPDGSAAAPDDYGVAANTAALRAMIAAEQVRPLARALRERIAAEGGALRSVACAVAAWRGYREHDHRALCAIAAYGAEGHVYC